MSHLKRAVVIGGGHNGLVCAAYLARSGVQTTLVERRSSLGGAVGSFEYLPGYRAALTNSPGSFEGRVMTELELERHGLRFHRPEVTVAQRFEERTFVGFRDRNRVAEQIEVFQAGEYARYRGLIDDLNDLGSVMGLSVWQRPDSLEELRARLRGAPQRALFEQVFDGSLMDLLDERLRSPHAKSLLMMLALPGTLQSPRERGSALGLMLRPWSMASLLPGEDDTAARSPLRGSVGTPIGSMSAIIDALERSARASGVQITTGCAVREIVKDGDGVRGVALEDGGIIEAEAVVSTVEPSLLQSALLDDPDDLVLGYRVPTPTGSAYKLALALDGLPDVPGLPDDVDPEQVLGSQIRIGSSPEHIEHAILAGLEGRVADEPIMWGMVPSVVSPQLAPEGRHLMSVNVWYAPHSLGAEYWRRHGETFAARCVALLDDQLPGLAARVAAVRGLTPFDIEEEFALTGSNITHGEMTLEHFFDRRPHPAAADGRAALDGLYLGGSGSWPGGYVTGVPGRNAARAVLQDLGFATR
ncbi:NAD(P)/FAD-dependent oxidoreductase [Leucobacter sp. wl10]|uniref:phytoene desaturase family protein n=1 Tax=Leucobacter sp. wl10 TaxID=2304677 RepID=UPI000E5BD4DD|nr:NAD(P)/FAD-dependent oxidoreductase [Leucobacter sp. wl10]RGE23154.1 NAD(P)/FAD-dependent oxidoreductase [Leucobacter sp. wl10]